MTSVPFNHHLDLIVSVRVLSPIRSLFCCQLIFLRYRRPVPCPSRRPSVASCCWARVKPELWRRGVIPCLEILAWSQKITIYLWTRLNFGCWCLNKKKTAAFLSVHYFSGLNWIPMPSCSSYPAKFLSKTLKLGSMNLNQHLDTFKAP